MGSIWTWFRVWVHDSETVVWARLQVLIGALWEVASTTDISPIFVTFGWEKWVPLGMMGMGIITELVRRSREPHDLGVKTAADLNTVMLPIKTADKVVVNASAGTVTVTKAADVPVDVVSKAAGKVGS